jgi:hypothetical protein
MPQREVLAAMTRQEAVVKMLIDGFGEENTEMLVPSENVYDTIVKASRWGEFRVDEHGNIKMPEGLPEELYYWIDLDLKSLDILREEGV